MLPHSPLAKQIWQHLTPAWRPVASNALRGGARQQRMAARAAAAAAASGAVRPAGRRVPRWIRELRTPILGLGRLRHHLRYKPPAEEKSGALHVGGTLGCVRVGWG